MLKALVAPFVLIAHLFTYSGTPYDQMVSNVQTSVVRIETTTEGGQGVCTGEMVAPQRVLTAAHCLGEAMTADGQSARVIELDEYLDLMLLDASVARPVLKLRTRPVQRLEPLTALGYAWGWMQITVLKVSPFLINYSPSPEDMAPGIFVQGGYIGGMSGGPVVDEHGEQVGIVQQSRQGVGYGVGADAIEAFLADALKN